VSTLTVYPSLPPLTISDGWTDPDSMVVEAGTSVVPADGIGYWALPPVSTDDLPDGSVIHSVRFHVSVVSGRVNLEAYRGGNFYGNGEFLINQLTPGSGATEFRVTVPDVTLEDLRTGALRVATSEWNSTPLTMNYVRMEVLFAPPGTVIVPASSAILPNTSLINSGNALALLDDGAVADFVGTATNTRQCRFNFGAIGPDLIPDGAVVTGARVVYLGGLSAAGTYKVRPQANNGVPAEVAFSNEGLEEHTAPLTAGQYTLFSLRQAEGGGFEEPNVVFTIDHFTTHLFLDFVRLEVDFVLPPTADFDVDPAEGVAPLTVTFFDRSDGATSWSWDFGDGETSTEQSPTHVFAAAGNYDVVQTVTNDGGSAETNFHLNVTEPEPDPDPEPELEPVFYQGSVIPGKTPEQVAAYLIAAPEWHFTDSPWKAVGHATTSAMTAATRYNHDHARFWTRVAVILVPAANSEHVYLGAGMADLREKYRV
jgi:PKD repeat protein